MGHDIFISYKSEEYDTARFVKTLLEKNRFSCWMAPESIPGGSSYAEEIEAAVRGCKVFVLVLSSKAQTSKWIKKEIDLALGADKIVMPLFIENCDITGAFNFYLTDVQRYNAYLNMSDALKKMVTEINEKLGRSNSFVPDFSRAEKGESVIFGSFVQEASGLGKTGLNWRVLDKDKDRLLLLSEKCIEAKPFNYDKDTDITWEDCSLRKWLNGAFINTAFNEDERKCIIRSELRNEANGEYYTAAGNNTDDSVFILSIAEAEKYFDGNGSRIAMPTEQVSLQLESEGGGGIRWWLRTPGYYQYRAAVVLEDGRIDYDGYSASRGNLAVRPAIWVSVA